MEQRFDSIYRLWYRKMALYAATFATLTGEEAEDLAHDALVHAWFKMDRYDPAKPFSPWLYRVARNFILDYLRRRPPTAALEEETGDTARDPSERAVASDLAGRAERAVNALGGKDRRIAMLVMRDGLTAREAAEALGMNAATIRWRVSLIRAKLRAELERSPPAGIKGGKA